MLLNGFETLEGFGFCGTVHNERSIPEDPKQRPHPENNISSPTPLIKQVTRLLDELHQTLRTVYIFRTISSASAMYSVHIVYVRRAGALSSSSSSSPLSSPTNPDPIPCLS
ncbi:hypothetical protein E1B28_010754 [Marasmius oreades]|uniref:Uncharacterized protein n=1 Tax=Marasmius oreades TaxID=181124 RepID=A0A9P7URD2_9AGAR|nr:uncharacterized protein E1B28_010754 [Marasmius oreades]KAG7089044.1 hypothetical protein E1B28_010754 [Marasmius oreades]